MSKPSNNKPSSNKPTSKKQYHIYGMGNALVDFEIETTMEQLTELSIDKGVMTLIEESRQDELFGVFQSNRHSRACGGSAANTIIGAQTLGSQCFYSCKVASDETGHFYKDDLLKHGVHSNLSVEALEQGKTGKCLVLITDDADRTMNTFLGITGDIDYQQIDEAALLDSEYLYVEGYLAGSPVALNAAAKTMQFAKSNGIKTAFSLSDPNMVRFCRDGLEAMIGEGVDLLFCNYDEATEYSNTDNLEDAIDKLSAIAKTIVVTLGADGAVVVAEGSRTEIKGNSVEAIDTNGAGDLFAGSFLHGLGCGFDFERAGQLASFASAQLVTQFGPRLAEEKLVVVRQFASQLKVH
jgi:sugar/nucleoside kinase (ribokinase family)